MNKLRTHEIIGLLAAIEDAHLLNWRRQHEQTGMPFPDFNKLLPEMERRRLSKDIFLVLEGLSFIRENGIMDGLKGELEKDKNEQED
jgi:hypothetical protein